MMLEHTVEDMQPASLEAKRLGITRERLVRQIQAGIRAGVCIGGRWFVVTAREGAPLAANSSGRAA